MKSAVRRSSLSVIALVAMAIAAALAWAEPAVTVKQVELKATPASDAKTVVTVPAETTVELVQRQGAWVQLKSGKVTGWAKLFDVRLASTGGTTPAKGGGNSLAQTLNLAAGNRDSSVTTGVRGFDEQTLLKATPNPEEFKKLETFASTKEQAQVFAKAGRLEPRTVEFLK
jgi:hypothetical protein